MKKRVTASRFGELHGFTIAELVIAAAICGFALSAVMTITMVGLKVYAADYDHLSEDGDMRKFTLYLQTDAAFANTFYIYDIATNGAPVYNTTTKQDNYVPAGHSGDLLLLVTTSTDTTGTTTVSRVVAYYRAITDAANNIGAIYRVDTGPPPANWGAPGTTHISDLYTTYSTNGFLSGKTIQATITNLIAANPVPTQTNPSPAYMPKVIGTASNDAAFTAASHNNLFYYLWKPSTSNGAFMVKAQIQEQQHTGTAMSVDTYNLTMWPRS